MSTLVDSKWGGFLKVIFMALKMWEARPWMVEMDSHVWGLLPQSHPIQWPFFDPETSGFGLPGFEKHPMWYLNTWFNLAQFFFAWGFWHLMIFDAHLSAEVRTLSSTAQAMGVQEPARKGFAVQNGKIFHFPEMSVIRSVFWGRKRCVHDVPSIGSSTSKQDPIPWSQTCVDPLHPPF